MEARFGHDFAKVRVHTDARAGESADRLEAAAYNIGSDITFAQGEYAPGSGPGELLLAHELAHVVQGQRMNHSGRGDANGMTELGGSAEREADRAAAGAVVGEPVSPSIPVAGIARKEKHWAREAGETALDVLDIGQSTLGGLADAAHWGRMMTDSPVANLIARIPGAESLATLSTSAGALTPWAKGIDVFGNVTGAIGLGMDAWNLGEAIAEGNWEEGIQAGADTAASIVGFMGPLGQAFSGGYTAGQYLDQALGLSDKASSGAVAADQWVSQLWTDESKPAYQQTVGWKLGEWLGSAEEGVSSAKDWVMGRDVPLAPSIQQLERIRKAGGS